MQDGSGKFISDAQLEETARLFGILSEPSRLRLLRALMEGDFTVTELQERTGLKQGNASKHLTVLNQAGFVGRRPEGNFVRYYISDERLRALCELMCARISDHALTQAERLARASS